MVIIVGDFDHHNGHMPMTDEPVLQQRATFVASLAGLAEQLQKAIDNPKQWERLSPSYPWDDLAYQANHAEFSSEVIKLIVQLKGFYLTAMSRQLTQPEHQEFHRLFISLVEAVRGEVDVLSAHTLRHLTPVILPTIERRKTPLAIKGNPLPKVAQCLLARKWRAVPWGGLSASVRPRSSAHLGH
jgi:hypothetical protein